MSENNQTFTRKQLRDKALQRYEKEKRRNTLAQAGAHQFVLILDSLKSGFNVPKLFRSAEAFAAKEVHLIDIGFFDPAPAKGSFRKVPAHFHESFDSCYKQLKQQGYEIFALHVDAKHKVGEIDFPLKSAFILGNEERGISFDLDQYPDIQGIQIKQFGQVQSLNVSIAGSIIMYEYVRRL